MSEKKIGSVLSGSGQDDYARYMRTDELLALQKEAHERVHPDELLFQVVHQSTELWLKLAHSDLARALADTESGRVEAAEVLLRRAALSLRLITGQLQMARQLAPAQFAVIRTALGNGSGFESPGWRQVRDVTAQLDAAFRRLLTRRTTTAVEVYRGCPVDPLYRLAEAFVELDERIALWRTEHYSVATRVIGHGVLGTRGMPVDRLTRLIAHRCFPELWQARTEITEASPRGTTAEVAPR